MCRGGRSGLPAPRDLDLPLELVRRLAADSDHRARCAIATRPRLPTRDLTQLLADSSESVAAAALFRSGMGAQMR